MGEMIQRVAGAIDKAQSEFRMVDRSLNGYAVQISSGEIVFEGSRETCLYFIDEQVAIAALR